MIYDLIVVGAGPAGCSTAITAARGGARVLLLERSRFPRHKVCGEFVSAESLDLLTQLLVPAYHDLIIKAPRITTARVFSDGAEVPAEIDPAAASISRHDLDLALWQSACESGVHTQDQTNIQSVEPSNDGFRVSTEGCEFVGRSVVNATGRWSFLTNAAIRERNTKVRWLGLKAHFREPNAACSVDLYFFHGGYCGVQPVISAGNGSSSLINACAMVKADVAKNLAQVFAAHPSLRERSRQWEPAMAPVSTSPLIFHRPEPVAGRILNVGDSATFVDPFIGDGISLALRSGDLAARSLRPFFQGECSLDDACVAYERQYRERLAPVFHASSKLRTFMKLPSLVRRPVMSLLQRTPSITRSLVRMTR